MEALKYITNQLAMFEKSTKMKKGRQSSILPTLFHVIFHNDKVTSFDFVESCLMDFFDRSFADAQKLAIKVHFNGHTVVGTYLFKIAEIKIKQTKKRARQNHLPLKVTMQTVLVSDG